MKNKDLIIMEKILDYCDQIKEACDMFGNDFEKFKDSSVFSNACCMCATNWRIMQGCRKQSVCLMK